MGKRIIGVISAVVMFMLMASSVFAITLKNPSDSQQKNYERNADKNVVVEIGEKSATLTANQYTDGDIYIAFYKGTGQMTSFKIYSAESSIIKIPSDERAAYAKIMWWNHKMQPNCEAKTIKLKEQNTIVYHIDNNDEYLQSLEIENPNPSVYYTEDGLILQDLIVDGYRFKGWYTAQTGGDRVDEIKSGERGTKTLYAHWEKQQFTINFASDMVPVEEIVYKTGEEKALPKPTLDKYTFVGWSDKNGKFWDSISAGTTGNITLYANWASNRNKAEAVKTLADPIICEDSDAGLMLFTYEIGSIKNVPLFTILRLNCVNGIISTHSKTDTEEISETQATEIAQTISNATTNSSSWTLSKDWNKNTQVSQSYLDQTGHTREEAETLAKSTSNTFNLSSSTGGSHSTVQTDSGAFKLSQNRSHTDTSTVETGENFELSVDGKIYGEVSGGLEFPIIGIGDASIGAKTGYEIGAGIDYGNYRKTTNTGTDGWSNGIDVNLEKSKTETDSKTWNTSMGYANSKTTSMSSTVSNVVSKLISQQYGYGESYSEGGSNSESQALATSNSKSDEYSSTMSYFTSKIKSSTTTFSSSGNTIGDYRLVRAGTVHVFAVVGYDVAEKTYFVYTYNVLDDETEEYLDYSVDGTFNDYETSIVPFEIPHFVSEYVNNKVAKTQGLRLDPDTGIIVDYIPDPDEPDNVVVIPSYMSVDNHDGTFESVKVKGIVPGLFKDNKDIVGVQLGNFITEIPDSAFEGCSSLKYVLAPGVTKIGNHAFSGCISLDTFTLPMDVTELGTNAFKSAPEIRAAAFNAAVAQAVSSSGADNIVLDISSIPSDELKGMVFEIGDINSFELQGKDKEYKGLSLKSDAGSTVVNGVTFTENTRVPLELSSENVVFDRVTVDCTGYALILKAEETNLKLNRNVNLLSTSNNTMIAKNLNLTNLSDGIIGKLNVSGNVLICGTVKGTNYLTISNGEVIYITEEEYKNYLSSHTIFFDANGGTVAVESKIASLNMEIGELPLPSRDYYKFEGWFTQKEGGEEITSNTMMTSLTDITVYAHWIPGDVSAWIPVENMPEDAIVVNQKWAYTLTSYTTSNSSSLSGWENYNTTWEWGGWSDWINWDPGTDNGNRQTETRWVDTGYNIHEYHYYAWVTNAYDAWTTQSYAQSKTGRTAYLQEIWVDAQLPWIKYSGGIDFYRGPGGHFGNTYYFKADGTAGGLSPFERDRWIPQGYTQWHYRDKIFTYYFRKSENKESTTNPYGQENVSNIREYVQYREK
ncbi:MAG: leucine-rich repeat protein [Eubacterium sp.]|nr:leucine-rich repeat protein [Eubacterium sp.]